jgi:ABC-type sugar transport system permease subunit
MPSRRTELIGWALCLPALLVFGTFYVGPAVVGLYVSFFRWKGSSPDMTFVGAGNYLGLLTDPRFLHALWVTLLALLAMLFVKLPLALLLAAGLSKQNWINRFYRSALFMPHVLSTTVVAVIWIFLFDPYQGLINVGLRSFGLASWQQGWLGQGSTALPSLLVAAIWWTFGLYVVLFTAGMARIPPELYQAIRLDTDSRLKTLRHVTIPLLREQIFVACIMTTGGVFGFLTGLFLLMTGGGPAGRTETLGILSYFTAFRALDFGRASAVSVIVLIVVSLVVLVPTLRLARQRVEF